MSQTLHSATRIGKVALKVSNLKRSIVFYTEVIGFQLLHESGNTAQLTADGKTVLLTLTEHKDAVILPERAGAGLYHFAILLPDRASLGLAIRNLAKHNLEIGQGDHLVSEAFYLNDPDNNGIEMYADRPRETWQKDQNGHYIMATEQVDVQGLLDESADKTWSGLPAGTTIGHVHFHVSDLGNAEKFYVQTLGFDIVAMYGSMAMFISAGGYHHHIGLNTWAGVGAPPVPENAAGLDFYSLVLPNDEERQAVLERLRQGGYQVNEHAGKWFAKDPFNIQVQLVTEQEHLLG